GTERGVVFQQYALFPWLTVRKNIEFGLKLAQIEDSTKKPLTMEEWKKRDEAKIRRKMKKDGLEAALIDERINLYFSSNPPRPTRKYTKEEMDKIVAKYLKMVQLEQFENSYPKELSGGMKQRVALARAYAVNPEILLLDEPFGALDAQTRTQLQTELINMWEEEKKTCLFITHDIEEAIILASRVIIMSARPGRIKEILPITLPHPRDQKTKMSDEFLKLKNYIWSQVYEEYLADRK
ncbi:MAG: ABC transporter ATP-binding protein, partial [Clostridia bacterium]